MNENYSSSPKIPSSSKNDDSSLEDYEEAAFEFDDNNVETSPHENIAQSFHNANDESLTRNFTTVDWEDPEPTMAGSDNFRLNTPVSSSGTSSLTGMSSLGVSPHINNNDVPFPFNIPEDQTINDVFEVEKDFMDFVRSFPHNVPEPQPVPVKRHPTETSNAKVGLDHLDNLCKLMEQLSDLKETNVKLRRRIQYLEDIKTLQEIHKEMVDERKLYSSGLSEDELQKLANAQESEPSEDSCAGSIHADHLSQDQLLGLYRSKTDNRINEFNCERGHSSRSATVSKERRERSKSVGHPSHSNAKKRPSRWSKVKEVLGIEKNDEFSASCSDTHQNAEQAPRECDGDANEKRSRKDSDNLKSPKLSCSKSHTSVLSSRSFSEAERQASTASNLLKKYGTLHSKTAQDMMETLAKEEMAKKSPKSPWGKMKTMIQIRRDNRQPKSESSSSSPRDAKPSKVSTETSNGHSPSRRNHRSNHRSSYTEEGLSKSNEDNVSQSNHVNDRSLQRLEVNYPNEHRHRQRSPHKHSSRKSSISQLEGESPAKHEKESPKNQHGNLYSYLGMRDAAIPKENPKRKKSKPRPPPLEYEVDQQQPCLPPGDNNNEDAVADPAMSPSTQRKWMWTKVKDVLKGGNKREEDSQFYLSAPSSPAEAIAFDFDLEKAKDQDAYSSKHPSPRCSEGEPIILPNSNPSATVTELLRELQQNLSDDFNKKLDEWQRCRAEGIPSKSSLPAVEVERKDSFGRIRKLSKPEKKLSTGDKSSKGEKAASVPKKDLSWLDKEQQKIDREIIRLSKDKQKFEKRSFRLQQLKEAMTDGQKKEVFVKTSAGEFRFEGISDAFTKKLYEWETKKGVNPELSTIALLDESLKPPVETVISAAPSVGSNSTRTSPEPSKTCFQVSRASSEPDLSTTQKDACSSNPTTRSKSGDTLLAGELEVVANLEMDPALIMQPESREGVHHSEDNYYSLLEENMYLLDQLKDKEEICSHLQNELERLDDKSEKTNRTHQDEMEKYRQKLWEIHMSRPRDLQGSLHLISELKSRIEELQKCSDKLKSDRERLEESFRFHSSQQARLADDLIRKVREMQITGATFGFNRSGCRRKWRKTVKCDPGGVSRIHDLSTQLLQQVRDVEQALMERTRQVCHLRWELLHRDMSAVLLQAALHRVTSQGEPVTILPTWDKRRNKFKNIKAWSVDTTTRRPSEDLVTDDWLQERLKQLSMTPYNDWANVDFTPNDLMTTAHELKKETLKLSLCRQDRVSDSEDKKSTTCSADSEIADSDRYYDTGSAVNSRSSSFSSGPSGLRGSHSDTRLYERVRALRRNSSSSMSCVEASDSSSLHDSDKMHCFVKRVPWRSLDNVSSSCSSRSSILDDEMSRTHWRPIRPSNRNTETLTHEDASHSHLQQKYGSFKETDEENEESKASWGSHCLITPKPMHIARISDTESDRYKYPPLPHFSQSEEIEMSLHQSVKPQHPRQPIVTQSYGISRGKSFLLHDKPDQKYRRLSLKSQSPLSALHHSTTDGSMESLDKYETAIRDEELTVSDEPNVHRYGPDRTSLLEEETFSDFEEDLKQRASQKVHSIASSAPSSSSHYCISDYIDKEKQASGFSAMERGNTSTPGSPHISTFKYKGTKGFGRPRAEYNKKEDCASGFKDTNGTQSESFSQLGS